MEQPRKAVVLLSGGIDSATTLFIARASGFVLHALTFDYGQRCRSEIDAAARVARLAGTAEHKTISVDLGAIGGSVLTGAGDVPRGAQLDGLQGRIPSTYVPARNLIFLSIALAWAETLGSRDIFTGVNAVDFSGYPDCRPVFIERFQRVADAATRAGAEGSSFTIHAPLIELDKEAIIRRGVALGVDYSLTVSCYEPSAGKACGSCASCVIRRKGFEKAGIPDPAL